MILNCCSGVKDDELILNVVHNNLMNSYTLKVKYVMQRDLVVQIFLLAKDVTEKRL